MKQTTYQRTICQINDSVARMRAAWPDSEQAKALRRLGAHVRQVQQESRR